MRFLMTFPSIFFWVVRCYRVSITRTHAMKRLQSCTFFFIISRYRIYPTFSVVLCYSRLQLAISRYCVNSTGGIAIFRKLQERCQIGVLKRRIRVNSCWNTSNPDTFQTKSKPNCTTFVQSLISGSNILILSWYRRL